MCGVKSRGNWNLGMCLRVDCINRSDDGCSDCFRFSNYSAVNEDGGKDEIRAAQRKNAKEKK
jgi:hypothetical protein